MNTTKDPKQMTVKELKEAIAYEKMMIEDCQRRIDWFRSHGFVVRAKDIVLRNLSRDALKKLEEVLG